MKKTIAIAATSLAIVATLSSCGSKSTDVGKWGVLKLPDGQIVEGTVEGLTRWSQAYFEVKIEGKTYLVYPVNFACYEKEK